MQREPELAPQILRILKFQPKGLTISDIAKKTGVSREKVSRQLDILEVSGKVELRLIGNAKVYYTARRVPLSAFLCFTKNLILVLDDHQRIIQVNDQCEKTLRRPKEELVGRTLEEAEIPVVSSPEALAVIGSLEREQIITNLRHGGDGKDLFFQMQVIPTTFDDGGKGCTLVLEDITEQKHYLRNMEFLARTAMELVDLAPDANIFNYIVNRILEIIPKGLVYVQSYDELLKEFSIRAIAGPEFHEGLIELLGRDPVGLVFPTATIFDAPYHETLESIFTTQEFVLRPGSGTKTASFYDICFRQIPGEICDAILDRFGIEKFYCIGLIWKNQLFGLVGIFVPQGELLEDRQIFESFIRQASIAIAQRMTADALLRSEQRFREVLDLLPGAMSIIDSEGCYTFLNRAFVDLFGYTLSDIPTGREWFGRAFPDPECRKEAVTAWKKDLLHAGTGQVRSRIYDVRCADGECKTILFQPVTLSDGNQYVVYREQAGI
ncbi:MAG: PAS domain S-box protein [Methanoregulaceae archaeon]